MKEVVFTKICLMPRRHFLIGTIAASLLNIQSAFIQLTEKGKMTVTYIP